MYLYLKWLKKNEYFWLSLIILGGFLIRLWILGNRWINPDEGAHLMDGKLVLDGLVPLVEFDSRQPLYVYIIALVLQVFGENYIAGRFIPLISTLGIILFIFLISKRMFDKRVALLASSIYAFIPFSVFWSTMVHMQPLSVLLNCIGVYCLISYAKNEKRTRLLVLSGTFFALAYYVRETSLALLVATLFYFAVIYYGKFTKLIRNYVTVLAGYFLVCIGAFTYYIQFISPYEIWNSSINPFHIVTDNLSKILISIGVTSSHVGISSVSVENVESFRLDDQPWDSTLWELISTAYFNSFLYVGFVFSVFVLGYVLFIRKRDEENGESRSVSHSICLLYAWVFSIALFYSYWLIYRGFYMQYFEEFLPPLVILLAFVITYSLSKLELGRGLWKGVAVVGLSSALVFIVHNQYLQDVEINSVVMGMYVLVSVCVVAVLWFYPGIGLRRSAYASLLYLALVVLSLYVMRETRESSLYLRGLVYIALVVLTYSAVLIISHVRLRDVRSSIGFIFVSLIISSFVLSFALSGYKMHMGFSSTWSPEVVEEASNYIKLSSDKDNDEVMSGGVIWEFEAGKNPFMNLSHPLAFRPGISQWLAQEIETHLNENPPQFIVLDGYTEQIYLRHIENLEEIMDRKYELKKTVSNSSRYPVGIYELIENNPR